MLYLLLYFFHRDIRRVHYKADRAASFSKRASYFLSKLKAWAGGDSTKGLPYLHILVDHIGDYMDVWGKYLGWGYGYFSGSAGEHLNKRLKFSEMEETNRDEKRFYTMIRNHRMKQLKYPDTYKKDKVKSVCSACHIKGHNKKNRMCPLHPSQPGQVFDESDVDD